MKQKTPWASQSYWLFVQPVCFEKGVKEYRVLYNRKYSSTDKAPAHYLKYASLFEIPPPKSYGQPDFHEIWYEVTLYKGQTS